MRGAHTGKGAAERFADAEIIIRFVGKQFSVVKGKLQFAEAKSFQGDWISSPT